MVNLNNTTILKCKNYISGNPTNPTNKCISVLVGTDMEGNRMAIQLPLPFKSYIIFVKDY